MRQLEEETATISIERAILTGDTLELDVVVRNLTGHKFPTGYPSRRAWIHVTALDRQGRAVFESGRLGGSGLIEGNASDTAGDTFEPHYQEITSGNQVQVYESIMGTPAGAPTTGLLQATRYLKDNRLLPRGFDKQTAAAEIARVRRSRRGLGLRGRVRSCSVSSRSRHCRRVDVELHYQPIGYRWAQNLAPYKAAEPRKFVAYYDALASVSSVVVARASSPLRP